MYLNILFQFNLHKSVCEELTEKGVGQEASLRSVSDVTLFQPIRVEISTEVLAVSNDVQLPVPAG